MKKISSEAQKLKKIYDILFNIYGKTACPLEHRDAFELMTATILAAQCTDTRVNTVTPALFRKYPDVKALAEADIETLQKIIRSTGFFRAKSANLIAACRKICEEFGGKVPRTMKELTSLPGIGRKTANVVLGNAFNIPGFPVDTHVKRLLNRIGTVDNHDPVKIEMKVIKEMPKRYWTNFSHLLIFHGRNRCTARKPDCENCEILELCDYGKKKLKK